MLLLVLTAFLLRVDDCPAGEPSEEITRFITLWGSQGAEPGQFDFPIGIAINAADEVLVTDHYNDRVQKFDADGKLLKVFAVLPHPGGIAVDAEGQIYLSHFPTTGKRNGAVPQSTPDRITVYSKDGVYLREWGKSGTGDGELNWPGGLALGANGEVFVADQTNHRIQVFDKDGKFLRKWGKQGSKPGEFGGDANPKSRVGGPDFLVLDRGHVFAAEAWTCRVQEFTPQGEFLHLWGNAEDKPGGFGGTFALMGGRNRGPTGICVDARQRLWIAAVNGRIQLFDADGKFLGGFGKQGDGKGEFHAPHMVAVNSHGQLYVVDSYNHRVQKFEVLR